MTKLADTVNIFQTIEAQCWLRDFDYNDYCNQCKLQGLTPLWERTYTMLMQAFDEQMEYHMEINND